MPPVSADTSPRVRAADLAHAARLRWRRNFFAGLAAVLFAVVLLTGGLDELTALHEDRTLTVGSTPHLVIRDGIGGGLRGGIQVAAGSPGQVHVEGKVHATWRVRYRLEQRGDEVLLTAAPRFLLGWLSLLGPARFSITAPPNTRLDIESRSAPIVVTGIDGGGSLKTTNGGVRLDDVGGRIAATSENGAIRATRMDGATNLRTTNGAIEVRDSQGTFELATTNGAITLDAALAPGARHRAETINGSVRVRLRGSPSLRIDARTTNGAITASLPLAVSQQTPHALAATVGDGEGELSLQTTNGAVVIE